MSDVALLLPGWGTPPQRFDRIRHELATHGVTAVDHVVQPDALVDVLARRARRRVRELAAGGHRVHLVGHSLGGLVAAWAATHGEGLPLASVTTINTPWRGTWLAWTGTGPLAAQLRHRSNDLACLRERLRTHLAEPDGPRWLVVAAAADLGTPPTTALRPGSTSERLTRRLVATAGHSASLRHPSMAQRVARHVAREGTRTGDDGGPAPRPPNDEARPQGPRSRQGASVTGPDGGGEGI